MTNADRIRAMSDEELAEQLTLELDGAAPCKLFVSLPTGNEYVSKNFAKEKTLEWLQQPAEETKMQEIADFIRKNCISFDWRGRHFYIWPTYDDMEDLRDIIPWDQTEHRMIDNAAVSEDGVCIDLLEVFEPREVEKYFPRGGL